MAFRVILTTEAAEDLGDVALRLDFSSPSRSFGQLLEFGRPAQEQKLSFNLTESAKYEDSPAVPVNVNGVLHSGNNKVGFSLWNLFSNDTLHMVAFSRKHFEGNVFHASRGPAETTSAPCIATCADGTSGQDCVTCVSDNVKVKICC